METGRPARFVSDEMCDASYNDDFERAFFGVLRGRQTARTLIDVAVNEPVRNGRLRLYFTETHDSPRDAAINKMFRLRNASDTLKFGSVKNAWKSGDDACVYVRVHDGECILVAVNLSDKPAAFVADLPFDSPGTLTDPFGSDSIAATDPHNVPLSLPPFGARVLVSNKGR